MQTDELIGQWATDNSGGIHLLYGTTLRFDADGTGVLQSWGSVGDPEDEIDPAYAYEIPIEWQRIGVDAIKIRTVTLEKWTNLNYVMSEELGPYGVKFHKLISVGGHAPNGPIVEWFWDIPEALFREKVTRNVSWWRRRLGI